MRLCINTRDAGGVTVLELSGHIALGCEPEALRDCVKQLVTEKKRRIVMNVQKVTFIDSSGLGELVTSFTTVKKSGGSLKLANPTKRFREILQVTHLLNVLELYNNEEEALASFS